MINIFTFCQLLSVLSNWICSYKDRTMFVRLFVKYSPCNDSDYTRWFIEDVVTNLPVKSAKNTKYDYNIFV